MAFIQDIDITVTRATLALGQPSFDIPLILGSHATTAIPYTEYSSMADVAVDYTDSDAEYKMAAAIFGQTPTVEKITIRRKLDATSISTELSSLILTNNSWYALLITSRLKADLQAAGTWANSNSKIFIGGTTDITALSGRNLDREAYLLSEQAATEFQDAAWVGRCLPMTVGSTWKWKVLKGITDSGYTLTELNTIRTDNGQAVSENAGQIFTNEGVMTSGENISTMITQDYIVSRIQTALLRLFLTNDNIPMDSRGIAQVDGAITGELRALASLGAIAAVDTTSDFDMAFSDDGQYLYKVTTPNRSDISANDRALGILPNVVASFYVAGAIKEVQVNLLINI